MTRYVARPIRKSERCEWGDAAPVPLPHPTVYASEVMKTGLLDPDGHHICRVPEAIGYLRFPKLEEEHSA